jgi:hypothetical protein
MAGGAPWIGAASTSRRTSGAGPTSSASPMSAATRISRPTGGRSTMRAISRSCARSTAGSRRRGALGTASERSGCGAVGSGHGAERMHLMPFGMRAVLDLLRACPGLAEAQFRHSAQRGPRAVPPCRPRAAKAYRA